MKSRQQNTPLFSKLKELASNRPQSFHVPGHKNGMIFPKQAKEYYGNILKIDMTELTGLDDLHAPTGVIQEAEEITAEFFQADQSFFLVGGSTTGNLAMIMATCSAGEKVIVQRNSHKSIINGLELCGAHPVFITPKYDRSVDRYTSPCPSTLHKALEKYPDARAVILTYPDYFGNTYDLKSMIELTHKYNIPVLVDEAHGVHFSIGDPFPKSALELGADVVVQSAHKMAPAMTMASYLHISSSLISNEGIAHYLQMIQSSSPSYPIMASLDIARYFLATMDKQMIESVVKSVVDVRGTFKDSNYWELLPLQKGDDILKMTLHVEHFSTNVIAELFERHGIYPELVTQNQILFIHGLSPHMNLGKLKKAVKRVNEQLKKQINRATIEIQGLFYEEIQELAISYQFMNQLPYIKVPFEKAVGCIAAEAVIPYPPGIPFILKGEYITEKHIETLVHFLELGIRFQQREKGIKVFKGQL